MAGGLSLRSAMMLTALVFGVVIAGLFYAFALRIARSSRTATLATVLFLLNGGLGFINFFRDWWQSNKSLTQFWNTLSVNYANSSEQGINWNNIVADMMVPQRTSLFGLSIGLMVFTIFAVLWQRYHRDEQFDADRDQDKTQGLTLMIVAGVLTGILPLFHTHTYIAVGLVSIVLFLLKPRREWLAFWTPALLLAAPQLLTLAGHAKGSGIVRIFFGWLGHDDFFFPLYLLRNFGLPLLLAIPAWWAAPRAWRRFYLAFLFLFGFSFVVVFSPNLYDNGKLIYYWHAVNSVLVATWLIKPATEYKQRLLVALLALLSDRHFSPDCFSQRDDCRAAFVQRRRVSCCGLRAGTHCAACPGSTAPALKSPVLCLTGRPVLRGATARFGVTATNSRERESDVRRIYAGTDDAGELLRSYKVDYIYLAA
jgi:hypothetical protein